MLCAGLLLLSGSQALPLTGDGTRDNALSVAATLLKGVKGNTLTTAQKAAAIAAVTAASTKDSTASAVAAAGTDASAFVAKGLTSKSLTDVVMNKADGVLGADAIGALGLGLSKAEIDALNGHDGSKEQEDAPDDPTTGVLSPTTGSFPATRLYTLKTAQQELIDVAFSDVDSNVLKWRYNNTLKYCFDTSLDADRISAMESALTTASSEIGTCIKFVKLSSCPTSASSDYYYHLKIQTGGDSTGCYVQGSSSGPAIMNLGWCKDSTSKGSMIHEVCPTPTHRPGCTWRRRAATGGDGEGPAWPTLAQPVPSVVPPVPLAPNPRHLDGPGPAHSSPPSQSLCSAPITLTSPSSPLPSRQLGHALGLGHEQKRSDRDSYVTIHWDKMVDANGKDWTSQYTKDTNADTARPYDYNSLMHYPTSTQMSISASAPAGTTTGRRNGGFDSNDLSQIWDTFQCPTAQRSDGKTPSACADKEYTSIGLSSGSKASCTLIKLYGWCTATSNPEWVRCVV